jgi:hypothetical protein
MRGQTNRPEPQTETPRGETSISAITRATPSTINDRREKEDDMTDATIDRGEARKARLRSLTRNLIFRHGARTKDADIVARCMVDAEDAKAGSDIPLTWIEALKGRTT